MNFNKHIQLCTTSYNEDTEQSYHPPELPHVSFLSHSPPTTVQSLSRVQLFKIPWTVAPQASLSITNSQSLLKLMSNELVMPSNHLVLCHPPSPTFNLSQHQDLFQ